MAIFTISATDKRAGSTVQLCNILNTEASGEGICAELQWEEWDTKSKKMFPKQEKVQFWNDKEGYQNADIIKEAAAGDSKVLVQIGVRKTGARAVRIIQKNSIMKIKVDDKETNLIYGRICKPQMKSAVLADGKEVDLFYIEVPVLRGGAKEICKISFYTEDVQKKLPAIKKLAKDGAVAVITCGKENKGCKFSGQSVYLADSKPVKAEVKEPALKDEPAPKPATPKNAETKPVEAKAPATEAKPAEPTKATSAEQKAPQAKESVSGKDLAGAKAGEVILSIGKIGETLKKSIKETYVLRPEWVEYIAFSMEPWSDDPARLEFMKSQQKDARTYLESIGVTGPEKFTPPEG